MNPPGLKSCEGRVREELRSEVSMGCLNGPRSGRTGRWRHVGRAEAAPHARSGPEPGGIYPERWPRPAQFEGPCRQLRSRGAGLYLPFSAAFHEEGPPVVEERG